MGSAMSSIRHLPDLHGVVATAGRQALAVGAEGHGVADGGAGAAVAEYHQLSAVAGVQRLSVGTEGDAVGAGLRPLQREGFAAGFDVPDPHAVAVGGGQALAVWTEGDATDMNLQAAERPHGFPRSYVPKDGGVVVT